jgi:hypothetical protein
MGGEMKIMDLLTDIERRRLILPEFQRGYVWTRQQVREFVSSLYRAYPTGSFLIWRTPDPGKIRGGGDVDDDARVFQLILDGQQRLTSIYTVIKGEPPPFYEDEQLYFNLHFNLIDERFEYYKKPLMEGSEDWIPVTTFFQQGLAEFFRERKDQSDVYLANFDKLQRLDEIRTYPYYLSTISEEDIERAVTIFNLVNSKGTRLSKSDLALAHVCSSWPEARQLFREARDRFADLHFDLGLDIFMRLTSTFATGSALYEPLYRTEIQHVKEAWKCVESALAYLVDIIRADAFIDSNKHLASPYPLIPLVVYLARQGGTFLNDKEKRSFLHWMYAALMWTRYSGSTETKLNADIAGLSDPKPIDRLHENILKERGRIRVQATDLERASVRSAFFPMAYIVARARGAVDWVNGHPLYSRAAGAMLEIEGHHIFPSAVLYKSGYSSSDSVDKQIVNEIANLCFLTKGSNLRISSRDPLGYLREVRDNFPGALEAQFVPTNDALWTTDRFPEFLAERRRLIAEGINEFMDSLIAEQSLGGETIGDLIAQGESPTVEYKASLRYDIRQRTVNTDLTKSVTKTIAAFLNAGGGSLLIGVMDDGSVCGIENDYSTLGEKGNRDGFELALRNGIRSQLGDDVNPFVEVTFGEIDQRTVAIVSCEPYHRPVFLEDRGQREFYVRAGNSSVPLDVKEASAYIGAHWSAPSLRAQGVGTV